MRALVVVVVLAVACGKISQEKAEKGLREHYEQFGEISKVECPDDVKLEKGAVFDCSVAFKDGDTFTVKVTQTNSKGDVEFLIEDPAIETEVVAADIVKFLKKEAGVDATVDCGKGLRRMPESGEYVCTATADGSSGDVAVTLKEGRYHYKVKGESAKK